MRTRAMARTKRTSRARLAASAVCLAGLLALLAGGGAAGVAGADDGPRLVKDITPNGRLTVGHYPGPFASFQGHVYFFAYSPEGPYDAGDEVQLWRCDPMTRRAEMAVNLGHSFGAGVEGAFAFECQGRQVFGAQFRPLYSMDGSAQGTTQLLSDREYGRPVIAGSQFFLNGPYGAGPALWRSDGTKEGTIRLPTRASSILGTLGEKLVFVSEDSPLGAEPWVSDGTVDGTKLLVDANAGVDSSMWSDVYATRALDKLFFSCFGAGGNQPWVTDGTPEGTFRLAKIDSIYGGSYPWGFTEARGRAYFFAIDGIGTQVWTSDGSTSGTEFLLTASVEEANSAHVFDLEGGALVSSCFIGGSQGSATCAFWATDGTANGSFKLNLPSATMPNPPEFAQIGGRLVIMLDRGPGVGRQIYSSDGTVAGTWLLNTVFPEGNPWAYRSLGSLGGLAYFAASSSPAGAMSIWRTDGTPGGTFSIQALDGYASPYPSRFNPLGMAGARAVFELEAPDSGPREIWGTDGTPQGTERLGTELTWDIPYAATTIDGRIYFSGAENGLRSEPWVTDGTPEGTLRIEGGAPAVLDDAWPGDLAPFQGGILFSADDGATGSELWRSDGTEAGTKLVANLYPDPYGSAPSSIVEFNGKAFFSAESPVVGDELFVTDGTPGGTALLRDNHPGAAGSEPRDLVAAGSKVFFTAYRPGEFHRSFWVSDGTAGGTSAEMPFGMIRVVADKNQRAIVRAGGSVYFLASDNWGGIVLFRTADALAFERPYVEPSRSQTARVVSQARRAFFLTYPLNPPRQVFHLYDPSSGERQIGNIDTIRKFGAMAPFDGGVGFIATTGVWPDQDLELWKSDGWTSGTSVVASFGEPGAIPEPEHLWPINGERTLLFAGWSPSGGREIWVSDGSARGTKPLWDLFPGPQSSAPRDLVETADAVYFTAIDPAAGRELWIAPKSAVEAPIFTLQPASQTVNPGQGVAFGVAATGPEPLVYEWEKDGEPIAGDGPALVLPASQAEDAGEYRCRVTGANGIPACSRSARLTVADPPLYEAAVFLSDTMPPEINIGATLYIGVTMRNTSGLTWSRPQGYRLQSIGDPAGTLPQSGSYDLPPAPLIVAPGETAVLVVEVRAPGTPGDYTAKLRMANGLNEFFGQEVVLQIHARMPRNAVSVWAAYE